jgi:hypothetical protein
MSSPSSTKKRASRKKSEPRQEAADGQKAGADPAETTEGATMPNKKALVVAIDDYGGPPNNLPSCIADGNAMSRFVQASYNIRDVHTLFDAKATVGNVERELDWLVADAKPDDRLVFFYSGHGYTKLTNGVMEEFLVLRDESGKPALWVDDKLVAKTQNVPTGALTVLLDCCFAGGQFKLVFEDTAPEAEIAQVKAYQPTHEEQAKAFESLARKPEEGKPARITAYRRFGCGPATSPRALSTVFAHPAATATGTARAVAPKALSDPSESAQPEMNALLVSACLETETAAASTSKTGGLSAFTHCMLKATQALGNKRTASEVFNRTAANLKTLGFRQTPLILERARPGTLKNRTFIDMEVRKVADELGASAFAAGSSSATDEEMQKFLPLLGALLPAVISAAPSIISAIRPRRKAFDLGEALGSSEQEEMQKFLPLIGGLVSAALPAILQAVRGRRKDFELGAEAGVGADVTDEEMQKFLPLLAAILPTVISAAPSIISAVRPRRKEFSPFESADIGGEGDEKIFGAVLRVLPQVLRAAPGILQAFAPHKGFEPGFAGVGSQTEADEKIFGAILRVLPRILPAAPRIIQTFAPHKGFEAGFAGVGSETEGDEKIFGAILRVLPRVLQAAPGIIQAFAPQKGFEGGFTGVGTQQEGDEKIFGAILRVLPRVVQAAPSILQTLQTLGIGQQKGFEAASIGGMTPMQEGDEKIFGAILRVLPQILQAAPGIAQAVASARR